MSASKFAVSQGCFYAQKLSLLKTFRSSIVRKYVSVWKSQTAHTSCFLKVGRLSGLCLSAWYIPFLRLAECKSRIPLSRRVDHLSRQYLANKEPSLALSDVWSLIRPYWFWFLAAVVSAVLAAVVNIQLPIYLGELIDKIVQLIKDQSKGAVGDLAIIKPQAIKLVFCYTAQAVLTFFYISFLTVLGERMAADLRVKLFDRLLVLDMAFFDSQKTAELTSRLNVDVQEFKSCFKLTVAQGLRTVAQVGGCVVSLFRISPQMTMYTVAALPLVIAIGTLFGALLRSLSRRAQAQSAVAAAVADEALGNIQTVRAFAMEEQESSYVVMICLYECNLLDFANLRPSIRNDDGVCIPYHTLWGEVRFEDVGFAYPTRPEHHVFEKLNLTIPAGQIVALCGPSGEGKSTITALLERFYEPLSGRILLDNQDLRTLNLEWLRGQVIGLISQEPVLFATSIEENIRYGRPNASEEEVMEAARLANAHEFISKFPDGYKTIVGERGTQLSGGQKQRIAIARALLKNPPILVLDEATSALDAESERSVRDALDRAMKGRTVLIIAHRLSTIRNANLICVIKDKKVLEQGTHDQLVQKQGIYYNLIKSQFSEN
ncbi:hypothetical protein Y032_0464g1934 [Ancylostoma ceylanicum]|uniref:ABC transporter, ATP-binding protein n=1 Tax=Ancylostoma ceylanicum TaxID=53326 RepID=A0A016WXF7_9BILA|nr:hypothetical protein Y032_0464g1934 [Ancylostoma ceylanicum]